MSVLIVGGDHLGSIPKELSKLGATRIDHVTGRDNRGIRNGIPEGMDLVILLHDYVNHNITHKVKKEAQARNVPIIFARRSWSSIHEKLSCFRITDGKKRLVE
ncbi:MAG: dihydroorotate dehydrogenase [Planctomycetes bacterium RIFCSPHIGHO2_02_FULL_50_42]|nr:MAG: dihydroorotate dehydrogenase [Planctomycetes bacterium GWA2_50_13]OHB87406.1 MAG: dihydroorotate dehydrogenase [Planctomycetes bacterium RIFCSPHIGHO2_02_FULL_50_42]OHB91354.1 MAG: dihydroorotate dehydrogenase [Planctomycetes bacterium RIFCSPHIGHO2_12_FULL_51_37]OHB94646.1 MAG: dihydroorotate dehydrogenase [Planctomycetes bacterium RIFCSPLOWO2_02_FULL_50_16]OHC03648.1 MAG: dihydroorotate dehydrogenase [Planctomycetes bacterium RIFCSPLOWO2_12_FULL_50_35]